MSLNDQLNDFVWAIRAMPRDELAAYLSILIGLVLVTIAGIMLLP